MDIFDTIIKNGAIRLEDSFADKLQKYEDPFLKLDADDRSSLYTRIELYKVVVEGNKAVLFFRDFYKKEFTFQYYLRFDKEGNPIFEEDRRYKKIFKNYTIDNIVEAEGGVYS